MGFFARNAEWLKNYFVPSIADTGTQPVLLSDDVQLTHPYQTGLEQFALDWIFQDTVSNPGLNTNTPLIQIPNDLDEVWRVLLCTIEFPVGPTGNFNYQPCIVDNGQAALNHVVWDPAETIAAGVTTPQLILPRSAGSDRGPERVFCTRSVREGRFVTVGLRQTSGQAFGTEAITVKAYVIRQPRGAQVPT